MSSDHLRRFSKRSVSISVDSAYARRRTALAPAPPCCSTFMRVNQQSICVRSASHTPRKPRANTVIHGDTACTSLLSEVVDRLVRWWDWCASAHAERINFQACPSIQAAVQETVVQAVVVLTQPHVRQPPVAARARLSATKRLVRDTPAFEASALVRQTL
jgi:hypothetical protein